MGVKKPYRGGQCPHGIYLDTRCFNCDPERDSYAVEFRINLKVGPDEIATWRPEIISRFFAGMAMALDAARTGRSEAAAALRTPPPVPGEGE